MVRTGNPRTGTRADGLRMTEKWTSSAKCVFQWDMQGSVAKSTHAGIPWLRYLRRHPRLEKRVFFWPFDGFTPLPGHSLVAEVDRMYPGITLEGENYGADPGNEGFHDLEPAVAGATRPQLSGYPRPVRKTEVISGREFRVDLIEHRGDPFSLHATIFLIARGQATTEIEGETEDYNTLWAVLFNMPPRDWVYERQRLEEIVSELARQK